MILEMSTGGAGLRSPRADPRAMSSSDALTAQEFNDILAKSKQLFNCLRDLPQVSRDRWEPYFNRTFQVFSQLWKFQQVHSLKRYQIGEIASKIGQLYYHYYLRTSECNYLMEAYSFYSAIRTRFYYEPDEHCQERGGDTELKLRVLRYYARFIIVCLLLRKDGFIADTLLKELNARISQYLFEDDPSLNDWLLLAREIEQFVNSDRNLVRIRDVPANKDASLRIRCAEKATAAAAAAAAAGESKYPYRLEQAVIASNLYEQVKVSELTLNMFRILQTIEQAPYTYDGMDVGFKKTPSLTEDDEALSPECRPNPRKLLLYKPSIANLIAAIASLFRDAQRHSVLMIYIAALGHPSNCGLLAHRGYELLVRLITGQQQTQGKKNRERDYCLHPHHRHQHHHQFITAVVTHSRPPPTAEPANSRRQQQQDAHVLTRHDLVPFTRKPIFLVIDSYNGGSRHFANMETNRFGQPFLALLSPINLPEEFRAISADVGDLFTMFLACPMQALCLLCSAAPSARPSLEITHRQFDEIVRLIETFQKEIKILIDENDEINPVFRYYTEDNFLRSLITRFFLCFVVLSLDRRFQTSDDMLPTCVPPFGTNVLHGIGVRRLAKQILVTVQSALDSSNIAAGETSTSADDGNEQSSLMEQQSASSSKMDISSV